MSYFCENIQITERIRRYLHGFCIKILTSFGIGLLLYPNMLKSVRLEIIRVQRTQILFKGVQYQENFFLGRFLKFLWILCFISTFYDAHATEPLVFHADKKSVALPVHCELFHGNFDEKEILNHSTEFKPYHFKNLVIGFDANSLHWFRFSIKNQHDEDLILKVIRARHGIIELYELQGNSLKKHYSGGLESEHKNLFIESNHDVFPLNIAQNEQKVYYLKVARFENKSFWAEVFTERAYISQSHKNDLLEGIILGGLLIVTIYQFLIYFITREKDYLRLSIYLLSLVVLSFMISGFLYEFLPYPKKHLQFHMIALPLTTYFSYYFAYYFLDIQKKQSKIVWYGSIILLIFTTICFIAALTNQLELALSINLASLCSSILFIYAGFNRRKQGFKPANSFLIAYIPTTLTIISFILFTAGFISYSWLLENSLIIGFCLHGILFSVAVARKIKTYKDEADASMLAQKENLEILVEKRTHDLALEKNKIEQQSEKLKMVMKELHHRVKNNLTIVSSLLELQGNRLSDEVSAKAFQEGQQRIEAMSLIHQRLYKSDALTTINMSEYISELISNLMHAYGYNRESLELKTNIECEELDIDNAIPLGLILNELLTNVFKYAFSEAKKPHLEVNLLNHDGILLEVKDNGKGIDLEKWNKPSGSFGKRLIYALAEQIGGEIEVENEDGACFRIAMN
jgi:two-component sensor histidine kinase